MMDAEELGELLLMIFWGKMMALIFIIDTNREMPVGLITPSQSASN